MHPKIKRALKSTLDDRPDLAAKEIWINLYELAINPETEKQVIEELTELQDFGNIPLIASKHPKAPEIAKRRYLMRKYS